MRTILMTLDIYDNSTMEDVEKAINTSLNDKGIDYECKLERIEDEKKMNKSELEWLMSHEDYGDITELCEKIGITEWEFEDIMDDEDDEDEEDSYTYWRN